MQVYSDNKLVGTLKVDMGHVRVRDRYRLQLAPALSESVSAWADEPVDWSAPVATRSIELNIRRRRFSINAMEIEMMRGGDAELEAVLRARGVPDYASKDRDFNRDATIYSWPVFDVDKAQHEELFDLDIFTPV